MANVKMVVEKMADGKATVKAAVATLGRAKDVIALLKANAPAGTEFEVVEVPFVR